MARGRVYTLGFTAVSLPAVQDLFSILATANMALEIQYIKLSQITQTTIGGLKLRLRRATATVTVGSGGSAFTPLPVMPNDAAATFTARVNDTVQMTTSGGFQDLPDGWDLPFGYVWMPPEPDRIIIKPSQGWVLSLDSVPSPAITASGHMAVAELF